MNHRSLTLLLTVLLASACGFQPLQGVEYRSSLAVDLSSLNINVEVASMTTTATSGSSTASSVPRRYAELLKAEIKDRVNPMNTAGEKLYNVDISYTETDVSLFVRPDGTASRGNMVYNSKYVITRILDKKVVASGSLQSVSSFNSSPTADYSSYVSIEDARKRAVLDLAQTYQLRLAALLPTLNDPAGSAVEKKPENLPILQPVRGYENSTSGN